MIDFGLSEQTTGTVTLAGGTLHAMSPEMLQLFSGNMKATVRANTDIYSLGVLLLELIDPSRIHYHHAGPAKQPLEKYLKLRDISPYTLPSQTVFSKEFRKFMQACLCPDPNKRPTSQTIWKEEWLDAQSVTNWRDPQYKLANVYLDEVSDLCRVKAEESGDIEDEVLTQE